MAGVVDARGKLVDQNFAGLGEEHFDAHGADGADGGDGAAGNLGGAGRRCPARFLPAL